ncbi:hypothetical protein RCH18_000827 [Flavobacterium sp. PL11]|uniref:hypothetical protein n=1 Tax=Flavobacterium sp. PL11 TaxID=3071717 RepID=UPI002E0B7B44|nr:hypothetical protein [Flavobacterium sp. PL11]
MRNILNKSRVAGLVMLVLAFSSCDAILDQDKTDFGNGPVLTSFAKPVNVVNIVKDVANTPVKYEFDLTYNGGKGLPLDKDVTVVIATSPKSVAKEGVEFSLPVKSFTIPAGTKTAKGSLSILTGGLVPFVFKDIVLEIKESSESVAELNTITITVKALGANSLAGTYEIITGSYWRIGVPQASFAATGGGKRVIEAISETLYKHTEYVGSFAGQPWYFSVDDANKITVSLQDPSGANIKLNNQPIITCESNAGNMTNAKCGTSNFVTRTNDRKDVINVSVGYLSPDGPREFYEVLRRIE